MRPLLFLLLLVIPVPVTAEEKNYCNEGTTYEMRECAFKKLVSSDKQVRTKLDPRIFETWVEIRQEMCEQAYENYKEGTIYPQMIMKCSIELNNKFLEQTRGLN